MPMRNPYSARGAPVSGERLVGRNRILKRLFERISNTAHCSIVGLPRLGKTSVARETVRQLQLTVPEMMAGYVTLDALSGPSHAYARILEDTERFDANEPLAQLTLDHDASYENFLRTLRKRRRAGQRSVVIVDEVDAILRSDFNDAQLFVSRIREVANDRERYGLTFVFVSRRSLDMIQGAVDCSTLAGLCEVFYLQPLERDGIAALAARSPVPVEQLANDMLWSFTGGHPFLAEVVMCEAIEMGPTHIDQRAMESAQHAQSHEFTNHYRQLSVLLAQDGMFEAMCELVVGPRWRSIPPHSVCLLKHYGMLRSSTEISGGVDCISQHFRDYVELLSRTTPSWVLLGDTERQLRNLVQDRMTEAYGEQWFEALRQKNPRLTESFEKLLQQRIRERRQFGDSASDFVLDYTYIGDLKDMIFSEWEIYRSTLGGSKSDWERRFQDVMKVRNPMAHHRPVPADVLQDAERSCRSILIRLSGDTRV